MYLCVCVCVCVCVCIIFMLMNVHYQGKDLLQLMMDATLEEREEEEDSNCPLNSSPSQCNKLTSDDIAGLAAGFLMAGYETTATTLTYTTYLLALNPDIQEKLQEEIETYFEDNPVSINIAVKIGE